MTQDKKMVLSERQVTYIQFLRKGVSKVWVGGVNKIVVNSLVKKGLAKVDKTYHMTLTKLGKTIPL